MKILFFIRSLVGGGAERVTTILANTLANQGHHVKVFIKDNIIDYDLNNEVEIYFSPPSKYNNPLLSYYKRYNDSKIIIKDFSPDVIVASYGCNLLQVLLAASKVPVIASEHNTFDRKHSIHEKINRFILNRFCNKVVVLTRYDKVFVSRQLNNVVVIPNPLSFEPMSEEEYESSYSKRHNILACGRLNAYHVKGFDTLIECFSTIARKYLDWDLDIAGKGDKESENYLKRLCIQYNIEERVHFIGFSEHIENSMKEHSLFALTSRSEGFGMVLTEAMSMGCPCVSFDLSGPSEIIVNSVDGLLVENQNKEAFSNALEKMIDDEKTRRTFGRRGLTNVRRFSQREIIKQWITLFESVSTSNQKA